MQGNVSLIVFWVTLVLGTGKKRERKNECAPSIKTTTRDEHCFCLAAEIRQKTGMIGCSRNPFFRGKKKCRLLVTERSHMNTLAFNTVRMTWFEGAPPAFFSRRWKKKWLHVT